MQALTWLQRTLTQHGLRDREGECTSSGRDQRSMPSVGGMDCLIDGRRSRLAVEDIARSALLTAGAQVRYTASRPLELPLPGRELQLWRQFYKLEDPCPAALAIVMQVSACLLRVARSQPASCSVTPFV